MMQSPSQRGRIETELKTLIYDAIEHDPVPVSPRDQRGARLRGNHAQTKR
jgi:hypothetical protein